MATLVKSETQPNGAMSTADSEFHGSVFSEKHIQDGGNTKFDDGTTVPIGPNGTGHDPAIVINGSTQARKEDLEHPFPKGLPSAFKHPKDGRKKPKKRIHFGDVDDSHSSPVLRVQFDRPSRQPQPSVGTSTQNGDKKIPTKGSSQPVPLATPAVCLTSSA
jgi:hypothetical protein